MSDYKSTLLLPKTTFPMKANLRQREPETLAAWEENNTYAKMTSANDGGERFVLHDGPPYANGHIHYGHGHEQGSQGHRGQVAQHAGPQGRVRSRLGLPRPAD